MYINIIIFFIILLILTLILHHSRNYKEGFFDFPDAKHNNYVESSHKIFNELTNTINITDPNIPISPVSAKDMELAVGVLDANPTPNIYSLKPDNDYPIPDKLPNTFEKSKVCEVKPATCSAFDDPEFAKLCGVSFDNKGINSSGKPHSGGLFISDDDRKIQMAKYDNVKSTGSAPYDPYKVFQPTIGKAKPGTFGITKDQCIVVKEKVDCESKQSFNSPNCTQCFTSQNFSRVDPSAQKLPSTLKLFGNGVGYVWTSDTPEKNLITKGGIKLSPNTPTVVNIPGNAEGTVFSVVVEPSGEDLTYVAGYLEGKTPRGSFKLDLMNFVKIDQVSRLKPRINGTININGFRCLVLIPGNGQTYMNLACMMPFSFLNVYDTDALTCDNGPIITQEASATFLESDPCFGKKNKPGNYVLECLQTRWVNLGGTPQGTGYPSNQTKANALQIGPDGNPLQLDDIIENLAVKIKQALTGTDANGIPLSINDWNTVSMWATGVPINTPCDGPNKNSGPLTKDCLSYLYMNKGVSSHIGPTYTLFSGSMASMKGQNTPNTYCQPGTPLDPNTPEGLKFAQKLGGINAVKQTYDQINRLANDNAIPNDKRQEAINKCYGVQLRTQGKQKRTGPIQAFAVGPGYNYTKAQSQEVCSQYGAQVATTAQLQDAQNKGADWCFTAWVSDSDQAMYPITTSTQGGCGNGRTGLITYTPGTAGVTCYGPKPGIEDVPARTILPFNQSSWDATSSGVSGGSKYTTVTGGYLQTSSSQPSCFNGLSAEQAQKACDDLGSKCGGFSYSVDGKGSGCYKGDVKGGMVNDKNYMGYVKGSLPTQQSNRQGVFTCIAGAQGGGNYNIWYTDSSLASPQMSWTQIPGGLSSLSLAPQGFMVGTNSAGGIYYLNKYNGWSQSNSWSQIPGSLSQINTDGKLVCGVNSSKSIFIATINDARAGKWTHIPGALNRCVVFNNQLYGIGTDNKIYCKTNPSANWIATMTAGYFKDIAFDEGVVLVIGTDGNMNYADSNLFNPSGGWTTMPNQPTKWFSASLSKGSIYAIDMGGQPWYNPDYKTSSWTKIVGGGQLYPSHRMTTV